MEVPLFDETLRCPDWPNAELYFKSWAELTIDIETAAGVTVIVSSPKVRSCDGSWTDCAL